MQRIPRRSPSWRSIALLSAVTAVATVTAITTVPVGAKDAALDTAHLANLVRQDCGSCHGTKLLGGLGPPLTAEHLRGWDREQMVKVILDGVPGTPMPPWRPLLSEQETQWIADRLLHGDLP